MKHVVHSVEDLGLVIRAVRKSAGIRLDDLASTVKVSKQFTSDVERGKPTVQMGRVMRLLEELGVPLSVDIPESVLPVLQRLEKSRGA